jgi:hypothetical protein
MGSRVAKVYLRVLRAKLSFAEHADHEPPSFVNMDHILGLAGILSRPRRHLKTQELDENSIFSLARALASAFVKILPLVSWYPD